MRSWARDKVKRGEEQVAQPFKEVEFASSTARGYPAWGISGLAWTERLSTRGAPWFSYGADGSARGARTPELPQGGPEMGRRDRREDLRNGRHSPQRREGRGGVKPWNSMTSCLRAKAKASRTSPIKTAATDGGPDSSVGCGVSQCARAFSPAMCAPGTFAIMNERQKSSRGALRVRTWHQGPGLGVSVSIYYQGGPGLVFRFIPFGIPPREPASPGNQEVAMRSGAHLVTGSREAACPLPLPP